MPMKNNNDSSSESDEELLDKYTATLSKLADRVINAAEKTLDQLKNNQNDLIYDLSYRTIINDTARLYDSYIEVCYENQKLDDTTQYNEFHEMLAIIPRNRSWPKIILGVGLALLGLAIAVAGFAAMIASAGTSTLLSAAIIKFGASIMTAGISQAGVGAALTAGGSALAYSGRDKVSSHMKKFIKHLDKKRVSFEEHETTRQTIRP